MGTDSVKTKGNSASKYKIEAKFEAIKASERKERIERSVRRYWRQCARWKSGMPLSQFPQGTLYTTLIRRLVYQYDHNLAGAIYYLVKLL
jgi:hypothetical protein